MSTPEKVPRIFKVARTLEVRIAQTASALGTRNTTVKMNMERISLSVWLSREPKIHGRVYVRREQADSGSEDGAIRAGFKPSGNRPSRREWYIVHVPIAHISKHDRKIFGHDSIQKT